MSYLPLLILELILFPAPLVYLIINGSYNITPVLFILCNCTLIWFLQYGTPVLNSRLNYHSSGYAFPVIVLITIFLLPFPMVRALIAAFISGLLALILYAEKDSHRVSVFGGVLSMVLFCIGTFVSSQFLSFNPDILKAPLLGIFSRNIYLIPLPLLILAIVIVLNVRKGEVALSSLWTHILTSITVLTVITSSGLLIPVFPVCRFQTRYTQILSFRLMIYISLFQLFLFRHTPLILLAGSVISILSALIIMYKGRTLYRDSRFHIIHL